MGSTYSIIGPLPAPVRGGSDITELYVQKFGKPWVGSRVFIRGSQFNTGWQGEPVEFQARVPAG